MNTASGSSQSGVSESGVSRSSSPFGPLLRLSRVTRTALVVVAALSFLNAAAIVAQAFLFSSVIASLMPKDEGINFSILQSKLWWLAVVILARALVTWATRMVATQAAANTKEELRTKVIDKTLALGPEWIATRGSGELTSLATKGLDALDTYFTEYLPALVTAAVLPITVGAAILVADWLSAVIILLTVPLLPLFAILIGKHTEEKVAASAQAVQRLSGNLLEMIRALPVLTAFRRAEAQTETVRRVSDRHRLTTLTTLKVAFSSALALELAATLSVALVAVTVGLRLVSGDLTLAIGLGVLMLAPECYQPWRAVGAAFHSSEEGMEAVRQVAEIITEPVQVTGNRQPGKGEIRVSGLRVSRRGQYAPDGASFIARPGEITWLRSASGSGKSTILSVLLGFNSPSSGTVRVDGVDFSEIDQAAWRKSIAWVPQNPILGVESVSAELESAVADQGEQVSATEIASIADELGLFEVIDRPVTELSLGQRQRIAVAKAALRIRHGAWLLLLDEPIAHLDADSGERVMDLVRNLTESGAAVIIAAHDRPAVSSLVEIGAARRIVEESLAEDVAAERNQSRSAIPFKSLVDRRLLVGVVGGAVALLCGIALTATSGWLIAKASQQPPILTLSVAIVGVRAFGLGRSVVRYLERLATHDAALRIVTRLRAKLWAALVRLGPARSAAFGRGEGQRRLVHDVDTIRDLLPRVLSAPAMAFAVVVCACVIQLVVLPKAGLSLVLAAIAGMTVVPWLALRAERQATTAAAQGRRELHTEVLGLLTQSAELIAFGGAQGRQQKVSKVDKSLLELTRKQAWGAGLADGVIVLLCGLAAIFSLGCAAGAVRQAALNPVLAAVLVLVPLALVEALSLLPTAARNWGSLRRSRERLGELIKLGDEAAECSQALSSVESAESGRIEIHNADFRWPTSTEPVLRGVSLVIPAGSKVTVVGASGAGKSTLLAVLLGFLPPERGTACLPARVAWAPQEPQLVSSTVAENLKLGNPNADVTQLSQALRAVELSGLDPETLLGDKGAGLSGGQAHRLALARALLAVPNSQLVLLDEPTAHLDASTAQKVRANLVQALAGVTVVQVTHQADEVDLSALNPQIADSSEIILEVRDGRVISYPRTRLTSPESFEMAGRI